MKDHGEADIYTAAHGGPHAAADGYSLKEAAHSREPTLEQAPGRSYSPWKGAHAGAGRESDEEGVAKWNCDSVTVPPFPIPLALLTVE